MQAILVLEDGKHFKGRSFGVPGEVTGEVVFNTSMTGYQEILTDPSYKGQMVAMTYPLIGNYGVNVEDVESTKISVEALIIRELCRYPSNFRLTQSLDEYLKKSKVMGIEGVDTRALTRHIRLAGSMKGIISTESSDIALLAGKAKAAQGLENRDTVQHVTTDKVYEWDRDLLGAASYHVVAIDCGIKFNILRCLNRSGCRVTVVPASTSAQAIGELSPDGIFISNGPGDPAGVPYVVETVKSLIGKFPIFGICLGHQILGLALGGKTYKLKFGHHGANHPVQDLNTGEIKITAQNHCFNVDNESLKGEDVKITHLNLNDRTVEGLELPQYNLFSVQYHPEASPGPHDAAYMFRKFTGMMDKNS